MNVLIFNVCVCGFVLLSLLGKVSIRKDDLCKYSGKENWFSLQTVDPNSEVQVISRKADDSQM